MCVGDSIVLSDLVSAPVDVEEEKGKANGILIGNLILPRLIFLWPGDIAVIDELRLISFLEIALEDLLLGLEREVLVVPAPVVEVVIVEAGSPQQGAGCSQHIFIINP